MERTFLSPLLILIALLLGLHNSNLLAGNKIDPAELEWSLEKERKNISIYTAQIKGSNFKRFKGVMVVDTTLDSLLSLVDDISKCHKWIDTCKEGKLIKRIGPNESYTYTYNNAPWPVSDRDAVVHNKIVRNPDLKQIKVLIEAVPDMIPRVEGVIRVEAITAFWTFTQLKDGQIKVVYDVHNDPGGSLPAWLVNATAVTQPYNTLQNMRNLVTNP